MNTNMVRSSYSVIFMLLASCNLANQVPATPPATLPQLASATPILASAATATLTPPPSDTPTATLPPTDAPTPTIYPPVFDPAALGDNRELASFILTKTFTTTGGGNVEESQTTIGYIKDPFSAYNSYKRGDGRVGNPYFLIDGRLYEKNMNEDYWVVSLEPDPKDIDFLLQGAADMRKDYIGEEVLSAQFVGQEDFQGIPANHFKFDQTNLRILSDPSSNYKIVKAQGDLYLAQDGNYLLRYHVKLTGNLYGGGSAGFLPGVWEATEELSSINQLKEITLPADYLALKLELDLGLPVPPGTKLHAITHSYKAGDPGFYDYFMPATVSKADFLVFYKNLAPANGWTVSQVGGKTIYDTCQGRDCVVLKRGNARVVLAISDLCVSTMPASDICFDASYYR